MGTAIRDREFERVLGTYGAALVRLVASYESRPALREELLQDIAFALWRAMPSFRHEATERTFVLRIATNRTLSHLAQRAPVADGIAAAEELPDPAPRPDELAARMQVAAQLQAAVLSLPLALRQVLVLALEGLDHGEIAQVLGLSAGNVAVRLHRGKALLKQALGEST